MFDYIGNLPAVTFSPFLFLLSAIISFHLSSLMHTVIESILAPMFKMRVASFGAIGFNYEKPKNGKWEYRGHKKMIGFTVTLHLDLDKLDGIDSEQIKKYENGFLIAKTIVDFILAAVVFTACVIAAPNIELGLMEAIVLQLGTGYLVFSIVRIVISIVVLIKYNSKNTLGGYSQAAITMIRAGVPFKDLDLKPVWELNFKKVLDAEKTTYFPLYFAYLDASGKYDRMAAAVGDVENTLKPASFSTPEIIVFITLVYYYSYHYIDVEKAKEYYHRAGDFLAKDKDSNGMRIKGFYELNCFGNVEKAKECAAAAMAGIDTFSMGSERDYERSCIAKLNEAISRFQG